MKPSQLAIWMMILALAGHRGVDAQVMVGVLEHPQCKDGGARLVRPLFAREESAWQSLQKGLQLADYPLTWRVIGIESVPEVNVQAPTNRPQPEWTFARDFGLQPATGEVLPSAANSGVAFSGWCGAPEVGPLLALANAGEVELQAAVAQATHEAFDGALTAALSLDAKASLCAHEQVLSAPSESAELNLQEAWTLPGGVELIAVRLASEPSECQSEPGGPSPVRWYVIETPGGHPRFIGESLSYLASTDMDSDGALEHLFWFSAYNRDGYLLFNEGFDPPARFEWGYH